MRTAIIVQVPAISRLLADPRYQSGYRKPRLVFEPTDVRRGGGSQRHMASAQGKGRYRHIRNGLPRLGGRQQRSGEGRQSAIRLRRYHILTCADDPIRQAASAHSLLFLVLAFCGGAATGTVQKMLNAAQPSSRSSCRYNYISVT